MRTPTPLLARIPSTAIVLACFLLVNLAGHVFAGSPLVSVSALPGSITNESQESTYTLTLSAPSSKNIEVNFVMTGSAANGFDYTLIAPFSNTGQVVIPAGHTSVVVTLHTFPDDGFPAQEVATFNILNGRRYHIGFPNHANIVIIPQS
jgi:hypothetical protein